MISRRGVLGGAAAGTAIGLAPGRTDALGVRSTLATGLVVPWGLAFLPDGNALVTERESGQVFLVRRSGGQRLIGTIDGVDASWGEGGLMGIALSPRFTDDRLVYLYFSAASDNRLVRMRFVGGQLVDPEPLLVGVPVGTRHNGGRIAFGPDGKLYVTTGDANEPSNAQDEGCLAGKVLRVEPDCSVPADNPFGNEVWTLGHRNVQGLGWDRRGRLWATELGAGTRDELNRIVKGHNYGWPVVEGGDGAGPFHDPYVTWSPTDYCSPSGMTIVGDRAWVAALDGEALFSVRLFSPNARRKVRNLHTRFGRIRTVERAPDGSLWILTSNRDGRGRPRQGDDKVVRLTL